MTFPEGPRYGPGRPMNTSSKVGAGLAGAAALVAALVVFSPGSKPVPMKYRADEFNPPARRERDAGVLVGKESPCFREARKDPACRDLLRRFPDGGRP